MKASIKFLALIALIFTFSFAANAQRGGDRERPTPEQMAERQTERMVEQLELNDTQAAQVKEINLAAAVKMQEARENSDDDREAMREVGKTIRTEQTTALQAVLTEAQFQTYEETLAQRGKRKKGKGRRGDSDRGRLK
jgi:hypothetical protein